MRLGNFGWSSVSNVVAATCGELEAGMEESLHEVLMRRDGLTRCEANEAIAEARERVLAGEDPEEVLAEEFGLEPDYVFDLME